MKRRYHCKAGHTWVLDGEWTTMAIQFAENPDQPPTQKYTFQYCPICYGEWAVKQWPLSEDIVQ